MNWDTYKHFVGNVDTREYNVNDVVSGFIAGIKSNPAFIENALRNGKKQSFLIQSAKTMYKADLIAMPYEEINEGDYIEYGGNTWIAYEVKRVHEFQLAATLWLCNMKVRWQNADGSIHEAWAVYDDGVYSTTLAKDPVVRIPDLQRKLYLRKTEASKYLYVSKRIATGVNYDKYGKPVLNVYEITGVDDKTAHSVKDNMLDISLRSGQFDETKDNIDEMICDYIEQRNDVAESNNSIVECTIAGTNKISPGFKRRFDIDLKVNGEVIDEIDGVCSVAVDAPHGVSYEISNRSVFIQVPDKDSMVGSSISISILVNDNVVCEKRVEVVS